MGEALVICPQMNPKSGKSGVGFGKAYWEAILASRAGLLDTTIEIQYQDNALKNRPYELISLGGGAGEMDKNHTTTSCFPSRSVLTHIEDRCKLTAFALY